MSEQPAAKVITTSGSSEPDIIQQIVDGDPVRFVLDDGQIIPIDKVNHLRGRGAEAVFSVKSGKFHGLAVPVVRIREVHLAG